VFDGKLEHQLLIEEVTHNTFTFENFSQGLLASGKNVMELICCQQALEAFGADIALLDRYA
jgi:hypothetical protein